MIEQSFEKALATSDALCRGLGTVIKGREDTIRLLVTALISDGHALLEDYPGSGKTVLTKTLGRLISSSAAEDKAGHILPFRRIQFTPDMLPGDVLGVNVFDPRSAQFHFMHGPVFAHVVLADEINRTGPKVQAAFLECMAEKQVTLDNVTYPLDDLFFVVGTQNPLDIAGTYPLPLVQLDRFMFRIPMAYVERDTEISILQNHSEITRLAEQISPVCSREDILAARRAAESVYVSEPVRTAIVDIVRATRNNPLLQFGVSTRAALMLQRAIRGFALVSGRDHTTEDDLKYITPFVLLHRLKFHGGAGNPLNALRALIEPELEKLIARGV